MKNYKIIASDLDGTFLNKSMTVSPQNWQAVSELKKLGVHFVPASGRSFCEMPDEIRKNPLIRYYITSDGATVYDKDTDTTYGLWFPRDLGHFVLDKLYNYSMCLMVHANTKSYVDANHHNDSDYTRFNMSRSWINYTYDTNVPVADFKEFCYQLDNIEMLCAFFENLSDLSECKEFFEKQPDLLVAQSYKYNLEIFWSKAGKGNALYLLADTLGIDRKDTIAVGDSTNDSTMVKAAGLGLAMQNACEELKQTADEIICNNEEHSAQYILNYYIK